MIARQPPASLAGMIVSPLWTIASWSWEMFQAPTSKPGTASRLWKPMAADAIAAPNAGAPISIGQGAAAIEATPPAPAIAACVEISATPAALDAAPPMMMAERCLTSQFSMICASASEMIPTMPT